MGSVMNANPKETKMAEIRVYASAGRRDFAAWMAKVDAAVIAKCGLSVSDLPDCCFSDWFEDGMRPGDAARAAIREAS